MRRLIARADRTRELGFSPLGCIVDYVHVCGDATSGTHPPHRLAELQADWGRMEQQLLLSEPFEERGAIVSIHAGAGGTDDVARLWTVGAADDGRC